MSSEKLSHEIQAMTVMNQNKRTKTGLTVSFPPSLALILKANVLIEIIKERCAGAPQATRSDKIALTSICERGALTVFLAKTSTAANAHFHFSTLSPSFHLKNKKEKTQNRVTRNQEHHSSQIKH